jgi:undecaprenyl-diphosphatase
MKFADSIILGIVQGITEFIPVSSSAHLVLVPYVLQMKPHDVAFDVYLHFGTLLALFMFFWDDILNLVKAFVRSIIEVIKTHNIKTICDTPEKRLVWLIIIGNIPTAVMGFLFEDFFEQLFENPVGVSWFLIITGCILWIGRNKYGKKDILKMGITSALLIGIAQGCAIAPGISRSGITIITGLFLGLTREFAARYAFLLGIPPILGITIFKINYIFYGEISIWVILCGVFTAAISGYIAIKLLLRVVITGRLGIFACYCWIIGIIMLGWISIFKI